MKTNQIIPFFLHFTILFYFKKKLNYFATKQENVNNHIIEVIVESIFNIGMVSN